MSTTLTTDNAQGAGFAIIRLDVGDTALPSMPEGCSFSLQRASDALFLARQGWQESHSEHVPDSVERQGSVLELRVGPHVVDNMDALDTYRIQLRHTSLPASVIHLESLNYSPLKGKEGLATTPSVIATPPPPPVIEKQEEETVPEPAPEPVSPPLTMAVEEPASAPRKSAVIWYILALVGLLALGGGAYYWYSTQAAAPAAQTEGQPTPATAPAAPITTPADAAQPEVLSPLAQARRQLQGQGDATQSLTLARTLQAQTSADSAAAAQQADAVFLLVEDSAQKGSAEAMLLLGRYFDPVDNAPKGSIQSDPQQAYHWYAQARAAGQTEAADKALAALRAWAETAAAKGDASARGVLPLMK